MARAKRYVHPKDDAERAERHLKQIEAGKKNLKPCKPGEVRNPTGRPKRSMSIASALIHFGKVKAPEAIARPIYDAIPELEDPDHPLTLDDTIWINMLLASAANSLLNIDFVNKKQEGDSTTINFNNLTPQRRVDPSKLTYDTKKLIRQAVQAAKVRPETTGDHKWVTAQRATNLKHYPQCSRVWLVSKS